MHPLGKKPQGTGCFPCLRASEQRWNVFEFKARQSLCTEKGKGGGGVRGFLEGTESPLNLLPLVPGKPFSTCFPGDSKYNN